MESLAVFLQSLTLQNWLTLIGIILGFLSFLYVRENTLAARRERKLKTYESTPEVKALINRKLYRDGWRSVQVRIDAPTEAQNFLHQNWLITRVRLLRPWYGSVLARAENDDYATGVFYSDKPVRTLKGKPEGQRNRFVLEFFIYFRKSNDRGCRAKFKVKFSHLNKRRHHTQKVWAEVPRDAE